MKNILSLILITAILIGCSSNKKGINLVTDNQSEFVIVVSANADSSTLLAADEIRNYINKVSTVEVDIRNNLTPGDKQIIIGKELISDKILLQRLDTLKDDGFIIVIDNQDIKISGNTGKSNLYGAYTFIEDFLGCSLLTATEEYVPKSNNICVPEIDKTYEPAFSFRRILFPGMYSEKFRYWHKVETLDEWGMFVHTFQKLIPPDQYFDLHPEYFSLVGNHRLSDAQLCLSNPEVIKLLKENLRKEIDKNPEKKYWSVSQNDCYNYCECEDCMAMYKKYENISGAYIFMSNELAKEFPDYHISTLAYQFTRSAPKNIKPLDNVNIMFCSIECNRSMPLAEDPRSKGFVKDMEDWSNLTNNIFVWDYVVQFKNYLTPFPNFQVLQPNIQFFKKNNVDMMFEQGSSRNWSDLADLKQYLIAKLLWNPDLNTDSIIDDFLIKYYGPAEPYIESYFNLMHRSLEENKENEFLNIYGYPTDYVDSYLTPNLLLQYKELMDKAEASVVDDSVYLMRVLKTRLPVDFAYLDIALNNDFEVLSYLDKDGDNIVIRQEMLDYLNRFIEVSQLTNTTRINERNFKTEEYKKYVLHKLDLMSRQNIAKNSSISLKTTPSEKYPVGNEIALTDNLFGDLDFHNNWLGYEGEDMIVEIDLQKSEKVSQVNMNFLKAVNSWVFLPVEIIVEVSKDGKTFHKVGSARGDISDENYLVKSVPFSIKFNPIEVQFLKVTAISLKRCPEWHRGFGNPSWIFIDELIIE